MLAWPKLLNMQVEECDEKHLWQRSQVEKEVFKKKKEFDELVDKLQVDLNKVTN